MPDRITTSSLKVAYLTAGAAGMYCGSCMHDNTLARALSRQGVEITLIPTYTPVRTDEENISIDRVFFGGINVFLQQKIPLFRAIPSFLDRFFDQPWLIRWATSHGIQTSAKELGALTVSMLRGESGYQRKEVRKLCKWLKKEAKPQLINLSNMLIAGCLPACKEATKAPILVTLQGDDVFLEELPEPYKSQALSELQRLSEYVDGFLTYTRFYADYMANYLHLPREKLHLVPLGLDVSDWRVSEDSPESISLVEENHRPPTVGYLARLAKEKGLHILVDAFIELRRRPGMETAQLRIAGWLGEHNRDYAEEQFNKLREAGFEQAFQYVGEVDRAEKLKFLKSIDILSVPTVYRDPKGLFVLEALASGVPVIQPEHGAFPELLAATGGGVLVAPENSTHLADALYQLLTDHDVRLALGRSGRDNVHGRFDADTMARGVLEIYQQFL